MSEPLWTYDQLAWYSRHEEPEIRYWAAERLVRWFPERAPDAVALLVLDEHDSTPELVAENLRDHGRREHVPLLLRAFKQMPGLVPGRAYEALVRIGYGPVLGLAGAAAARSDVSEDSLVLIVEATAGIGTPEARAAVRDIIEQRVEILAEPNALRGALQVYEPGEYPTLFSLIARALQWKGLGRAGDLIRVVTDHLQVDDCGWCLRTGPDGRIDLRKTIKAVESGYDCELGGDAPALAPEAARRLTRVFRAGDLSAAVLDIAAILRANATAIPADPEDPLTERIEAVGEALSSEPFLEEAARLGPAFLQGVVALLMSCLFKVARYRNYELETSRAGRDVEVLLLLAETETAFTLECVSKALADVVESASKEESTAKRERILRWCRRMLTARGPFFPKAVALETIGALRAEDHVPELLDCLADDNSYIFGAAEKALGLMKAAAIGPARARIDAGTLEHEAMHSLLILLVDLGDKSAVSLLVDHFEEFVDRVGVGEVAEWAALLGAAELFDPLHGHLQEDLARVGQSLLLIGAIHNIPVPEEARIHEAIEDYWRRHPEPHGGGEDGESGPYVM